jgi:hypothetical protein
MVAYATLTEVKSFLGMQNISQFDDRLSIILNGVAADITDYVGEEPADDKLKLATCLWVEGIWTGKTDQDTMPPSAKRILDRYVDEGDDVGGIGVDIV